MSRAINKFRSWFKRPGDPDSAPASPACPAQAGAPLIFFVLLAGKVTSKIFGLVPVVGVFRTDRNERWYYTLLMSTGLTFGTISAMFGLTHGIVTPEQYSHLVAVVIGSAVIPTVVAGACFLPRHLLNQVSATQRTGMESMPQNVGGSKCNDLSD